ncbi:MAG: DUF4955 domain-containing protein, partial [Verrucomicrobia bacterium]|nr:DUF4955 domain-containing protein [Verrucomicrobiota bacterium]
DAIRKAVAEAERAGGGVVLFPAGKFLVFADRFTAASIRIGKSGVVIRGAGSGKGGTVIRAIHSGYRVGPYPVPKGTKDGEGRDDWAKIPYIFIFEQLELGKKEAGKSAAVIGAVKRGSFAVPVKSTEGFKTGDWVVLKAGTPKLDAELMCGLQPDPTWTRISKDGSSISELHQVKGIQGESLILKEPVLVNLGADFEAKIFPVTLIEQVGVEDMAWQGGWRGAFVHHRSALDDEGWDGIQFKGVANGWVRRCSFLNVNTGVYLRDSVACSILENRFAGNKGHYDVAIRSNCSFNMMGLTEETTAPQHGASTGNRSAGTVVWRWLMSKASTVDSHGNGPYATLIDRVDGGTMTRSGGPAPSFPNHLRWMVFWNFFYDSDDEQPINFWNYEKGKEAKFVKPLFVGLHGKPVKLKEDSVEANECPGAAVTPESLYEAQLGLRLGKLPDWVGSARKEWEKVKALELPPYAAADIEKHDLYEEEFTLAEMLKDWQAQMANQELGWAVPVDLPTSVPEVKWKRDYVLLRTVLQAMATYVNPVGKKDAPVPEMKVNVEVKAGVVVFQMPIQSDAKAQKKNQDALRVAKELAPACHGVLKLTLKR